MNLIKATISMKKKRDFLDVFNSSIQAFMKTQRLCTTYLDKIQIKFFIPKLLNSNFNSFGKRSKRSGFVRKIVANCIAIICWLSSLYFMKKYK